MVDVSTTFAGDHGQMQWTLALLAFSFTSGKCVDVGTSFVGVHQRQMWWTWVLYSVPFKHNQKRWTWALLSKAFISDKCGGCGYVRQSNIQISSLFYIIITGLQLSNTGPS